MTCLLTLETCNASRRPRISKSLKRINYCKCSRGSQACNTWHILKESEAAFGLSIVEFYRVACVILQ